MAKLTKNGKIDGRCESSKKNMEKARTVVHQAIKKAKKVDTDSEEEEEDSSSSDEEYITKPIVVKKKEPEIDYSSKLKETEEQMKNIQLENVKIKAEYEEKEKIMEKNLREKIKKDKLNHMRQNMLLKF